MNIFNPFLNGYCNVHVQLWDHLRDKTLGTLGEHMRQKEAIQTPEGVAERGRRISQALLDSIGGLPPQDTPLNARTVGILARKGYHIEKVIYESQPQVYVTALLYIPDVLDIPAPAVLFVCGHGREAKGFPEYQQCGHDFATGGFVTLVIDPTGQGERVTTLDPVTRETSHGWGTTEHSYQGQQCILTGTSIARYFLHDALRGLDYLATRPEVDANRIGITGNSGGGTQTSLVCMTGDPRIKAAVPCTYVTSREAYYQTGQPQDAEQLQFGMTSNGINYDDMYYPFAPRPLLIGGVQSDFFSPEGTAQTYERLKRVYGLFGKEGHVALTWAPGTHKYHQDLRQAAVNWFRQHLAGLPADFKTAGDDAIEILPDEELWCTPKGHVLTQFPDAKTPYHLNLERVPARAAVDAEGLRKGVVDALHLGERLQSAKEFFPRTLQSQEAEGLKVDSVTFTSEPGIMVAGALVYPASGEPKQALVYIADGGTKRFDELLPAIREAAGTTRAVLLLDVRGTGAVAADEANAFSGDFPSTFFGTDAWFSWSAYCLGENLMGMRVFDVLRAAEYLRSRGHEAVDLYAEGLQPALWGYLASAVDGRIRQTRVKGRIESYESLARTQFYRRDITPPMLIHGVLQKFDLPDLENLFEGRVLEVETVTVAETP